MSKLITIIPPAIRQRKLKNRVYPLFSEADKDLRSISWWLAQNGYATTSRGNRPDFYQAHRIVKERAVGRKLSRHELVDHRNRVKLDNRRNNLNIVDDYKNAQNTSMRSDNTTGHRGVWYRNDTGKWAAEVQVNGKRFRKSTFTSIDDAIAYVAEIKRTNNYYYG